MKKFYWIYFLVVVGSFTGNAQTFSLVKDIRPGSASSLPGKFNSVNGILLFRIINASTYEIWRSDGTDAGTLKLKDFGPTDELGYLYSPVVINNVAFFCSWTSGYGYELWKTDGTQAGTVMVKDINPGNASGFPQAMTAKEGVFYFTANDGVNGLELWKSDGTEAGTIMIKDINPGIGDSNPQNLIILNDELFFTANDGIHGLELWKSDGTDAGTVILTDITSGTGSSTIHSLTRVNNDIFFSANSQLWKTNGTATLFIKNISPYGPSINTNIININGVLYLKTTDGSLWKSDGTTAGTILISSTVIPLNLTELNGMLYFMGNDGVHGEELWKSNGTSAGTIMVKDIWSGSNGSMTPNLIYKTGNMLMFGANDGANGVEIWQSDGTDVNTHLVQDIVPGSGGCNPSGFFKLGGKIYASVSTPGLGRELWVTDLNTSLPLTLSDFKAQLSGSDGLLNWKTSSEQNTSHFEIERCIDGRNFIKAGTISASGNSALEKQYSYTDKNITSLGTSVVYYRLKNKDIDDRSTYSKIIAININNKEAVVMLYPNPVRESATLMIAVTKKQKISYRIIDQVGNTIQQNTINVNEGSNTVLLETNSLTAGIYTLSLNGKNIDTKLKFIKQ